MKPRRWLLALLLTPLLLAGALYSFWHLLGLETRVRDVLLTKLQSVGMEQIQLDAVSPTWNGLELKGLRFRLPEAESGSVLQLELSRLGLELAPLVWLKSSGEPLAALHAISIDGLDLLYTGLPGGGNKDTALADSSLLDAMRQLRYLPDLRLQGTTLRWRPDARSEERTLLDALEGLVLRQDKHLEVLLRSQLLEGKEPGFRSSLRLDTESLLSQFDMRVDSLQLNLTAEDELPGILSAESRFGLEVGGIFNGTRLTSLAGSGSFDLQDMSFDSRMPDIAGSIPFTLDMAGFHCDDGLMMLGNTPLRIEAGVPLGRDGSTLNLELDGLGSFLKEETGAQKLDGNLTLQCQVFPGFTGMEFQLAWLDPVLQGASAQDFHLAGRFDRDTLDLAWEPWNPQMQILSTGELKAWDLGKDPVLHLLAHTDWTSESGTQQLSTLADLEFSLVEDGLRIGPNLLQAELLFEGESRFQLDGNLMSAVWPFNGIPAASGVIQGPGGLEVGNWLIEGGQDLHWALDAETRLAQLTEVLGVDAGEFGQAVCQIQTEGWGQQSSAEIELHLRERAVFAQVDFDWSNTRTVAESNVQLHGWRDTEMTGHVNLAFESGELQVEEILLGDLSAEGRIDFAKGNYILELFADAMNVEDVWNLLHEDPPPENIGQVSLMLGGEGALGDLGLRGGVEYRTRSGDGRLRFRSDLELSPETVRFERGDLALDGSSLAGLDLAWGKDPTERMLDIQLHPDRLEKLVRPADSTRPPPFEGRLNGSFHFRWDEQARMFGEGWILGDSIRVKGNLFEAFSGNLRKSADQESFRVDSLRLSRQEPERLEILADGLISFGSGGGLDLDLSMEGDLLQPLMVRENGSPSRFFQNATGSGSIRINLGGTLAEPRVRSGRISLTSGKLDLQTVFRKVRDIDVSALIKDGRLEVEEFRGRVGKSTVELDNLHELPADWPDLDPLLVPILDLDLGVLVLHTLGSKGDRGYVEATFPGLMKNEWEGELEVRGLESGEHFLLAGPSDAPLMRGRANVKNARFTYPFIKGTQPPTPTLRRVLQFLESMEWDLALEPGRNINYYNKVQGFEDSPFFENFKGFLDRITLDLWLEATTQPLLFSGRIDDGSFRIAGEVLSRRGSILILDRDFSVEEGGLQFDRSSIMPMVWGRAAHTMLSSGNDFETLGLINPDARQIYVQLFSEDDLGNRVPRGRYDEIRLELVDDLNAADNQLLSGQEDLLAEMGLDPTDAGEAIQTMLPGVVAGFWELPLQPIESRLRRELQLDMVRIFVPVLRNTLEELVFSRTRQEEVSQSYLSYLQGSRVILGKSLGPRYFASWTGQLMSATPAEGTASVHFFQRYNLEYEVSRNLTLTGEVVFDPLREASSFKGDPRVLLRYRLTY